MSSAAMAGPTISEWVKARSVHPAWRRSRLDPFRYRGAGRRGRRHVPLFQPEPRHGQGAIVAKLADLNPGTLALMHGPSYAGDCRAALAALADSYDRRVRDYPHAAAQAAIA